MLSRSRLRGGLSWWVWHLIYRADMPVLMLISPTASTVIAIWAAVEQHLFWGK